MSFRGRGVKEKKLDLADKAAVILVIVISVIFALGIILWVVIGAPF